MFWNKKKTEQEVQQEVEAKRDISEICGWTASDIQLFLITVPNFYPVHRLAHDIIGNDGNKPVSEWVKATFLILNFYQDYAQWEHKIRMSGQDHRLAYRCLNSLYYNWQPIIEASICYERDHDVDLVRQVLKFNRDLLFYINLCEKYQEYLNERYKDNPRDSYLVQPLDKRIELSAPKYQNKEIRNYAPEENNGN